MQVLQWSISFPDRLENAIIIARPHALQHKTLHLTKCQKSNNFDKSFHGGDYYSENTFPNIGLSIARMLAHITYLSQDGMTEKFGRNLQEKKIILFHMK